MTTVGAFTRRMLVPPVLASPAVKIRAAHTAEHATVGELCVAAYRADGLGSRAYEATLRDVAARAADAEVLVAEADGRLLGTVTLVLDPGAMHEIAAADEGEFRMLAVDPAAQGGGAGTALVRACADRTRARGRRALVCSSQDRMHAAHRLYARLGFVRAPARDWSPLDGVDLLVFELPLAAGDGETRP
jgi:GNAT superfamily N-acetyltransferase